MYNFFRLFFIFIGVWIVTSSFSGFLCGICLLLTQQEITNLFSIAMLCSFICSFPFVAFTGLVTFVANCCGKKGFDLFQVTLATTLACAFFAALVFIFVTGKSFGNIKYAMSVSIIVAAIGGL